MSVEQVLPKATGPPREDEATRPNNPLQSDFAETDSMDSDERYLNALGYKQSLHRQWKLFESFAASFAALYCVGGVRTTFTIGIGAGGPAAYWSSYVVTCFFVMITAAVLAEICSALPAAGSIYFWAAESGGRRYGRLFGFIVAWWSTTAWTTFVASNCQAAANFLLSEITVFGVDFTTDTNDIKFRAVQWIVSEIILCIALSMNYMNPRTYSWIFKAAVYLILLDFFLNIIWLPIAASKTIGFQSAEFVFTQTYNETGAPPVWNWMLSYYVTAGILVGFEASGHISEETKDASQTAAKGIFTSAGASAAIGFPMIILFLFCTPNLDVLYSLGAPQPFVEIYAMTLGQGGQVFMTVICILGLILNTTVAGVASSRLIWAVARDGVLPFSGWISAVSKTQEPRNAVIVMHTVAALLLCTILPSPVAFTSLVSAAGVPTITAYALIAFGRVFITPHEFKHSRWSLGKWSRPLCLIALVWNLYLAAVLFSPLEFPVSADNFNYSPVIFGAVTIFGILSYYFTPEDKWLPQARLGKMREIEEEANAARTNRSSSISN
ncbi:amino acid transporter [Saccharata proteae CBS 121410]|uniref:Amino acid transporter n=1 Tax=Saccharata proteae CBS 121410 TaxID=1314787 RepID=A0A9P4I3A5_9PEZI|nr:amino acid transporter [Saccharata proteae CBS 121410]